MPATITACSRHQRAGRLVAALTLVLLGAMLAIPPARAAGTIRYAAPTAQGSGDCSSWAAACTLQTALTGAVSGDQIWVKAGVHKPGTNRSDAFQLKTGVNIYGGFAGTETQLGQRDWQANPTILSGDIDNNDTNADNNFIAETWNDIQGNNSYHVVVANNVDSTAVLDGVTITAGKADGGTPADSQGGGMRLQSSRPTLRNLIVRGNLAGTGGGLYNEQSSPRLTAVVFGGNQAGFGGGAFNGQSSPELTDVAFSGNQASVQGGGLYNFDSSSPTLVNVIFSGNTAPQGGGMVNRVGSNPTLTNVTFSGNQATTPSSGQGGALYNDASNPLLRNALLWGNSAANGPSLFNTNGAAPQIAFSDIQGCGGSTSWVSACGTDDGGNIDADPLFGDADGADNVVGTPDDNLRLRGGSPALDTGTNTGCPGADLDGRPRPVDGNGAGGAGCDMGAYEFYPVLYAAPTTQGAGHCGAWADACPLSTVLATATAGQQIWVQQGVHKPTPNSSDRRASFQLTSGVAIYGGFAGTETQLGQRDWLTNKTVLSGDIDNNDTTDASGVVTSTANINGNNSYHVVVANNVDSTAVLDGFIITAGKADGQPFDNTERGAGLYLVNSSPALRNLVFSGNKANGPGGGMYLNGSSPTLTNVTFSGNSANRGGGMSNEYSSSPTLTNVTFSGNSASNEGGGMFNYSSSSPTLRNVTFSGNSANRGGGMFNDNSSPTLRNAIVWGNTASNGPSIYNFGSSTPTVTYSDIQGCFTGSTWNGSCGTNGGGNIEADPLFVNAAAGNLRLKGGSPAIDAGNNSFVPSGITTDLDGKPRIQDGNGDGVAIVDMGAYEAQPPVADAGPDQTVSVGALVTLNGSGSSDPDGNLPLSYQWTQSGGPGVTLNAATTATPSFTPPATGVYTFTLVVTDSTGLASTPDSVMVTVTPPQVYLPLVRR